jgi:hypothetical protein
MQTEIASRWLICPAAKLVCATARTSAALYYDFPKKNGELSTRGTFLSRQLQQISTYSGALTAYIDEMADDVASAMIAMAEQFSGSPGARL